MFDISGKTNLDGINQFMHSAMIDEGYKAVGAHVDESTRNFAYVDFARLLP